MKIYFAIGRLDNFRLNLFTQEKVQRILISFAYFLNMPSTKANIPFSDVILDSGAFGVATGTQQITIDGYSLWLKLNLNRFPQITHYVNLDDLFNPENSIKNLKYMEHEGLHPMPVYHYGEADKYLKLMCDNYEYVGLGGLAVGKMAPESLKKFWEEIHELYPKTQFHIFGVGTLTPFTKYQPYSIDCSSWNTGAAYGDFMCYKDGIPYRTYNERRRNGYEFFFKTNEAFANNIRALLDFEKLEWLKNLKLSATDTQKQSRLF